VEVQHCTAVLMNLQVRDHQDWTREADAVEAVSVVLEGEAVAEDGALGRGADLGLWPYMSYIHTYIT